MSRGRFTVIHPHAAGIDVGASFHVVAVGAQADDQPVRTFQSFTQDLLALADWLKQVGVTTVAMESTGVYWVPVYELLEERGFEVLLVNARFAKNVPGRKTDVSDAQWLQQLHSFGLLRSSFRPRDAIVRLRTYLRHRERLSQNAAGHIQRMQKALVLMNVQLQHVVTDVTGVTGMRIIRAIAGGCTDPATLAAMRHDRCYNSVSIIEQALTGQYRPDNVFILRQELALYDFYQEQIRACDCEIETVLKELNQGLEAPPEHIPKRRHRIAKQEIAFDARAELYKLVGRDITQIHGIGTSVALTLVGECGDDMTKWPTAKHFTSWLGLAPGNKISGGRLLSSRTQRNSNRASNALRLAAVGVGRAQTALGAFYRRLGARVGKAKAVTATARKIAILFYNTMRYGQNYDDPGAQYYEERYRQRVVKSLQRRALQMGFELSPAKT